MYLLTAISNLSLLVSIALFCFTFSTNDLCINFTDDPRNPGFFLPIKEDSIHLSKRGHHVIRAVWVKMRDVWVKKET